MLRRETPEGVFFVKHFSEDLRPDLPGVEVKDCSWWSGGATDRLIGEWSEVLVADMGECREFLMDIGAI